MTIVAVLLLCFALVESQSQLCPDSEDIKPCICRRQADNRLEITCENLQSPDKLVKAVKNMGKLSVDTFNLQKSNIGVLPSDAFNGLAIENLNIVSCNLTRLSENRNHPPFQGLEDSLGRLEIKSSFLNNNSLTLLSLAHLKKLVYLELNGNAIPSIGNNWFESGPYGLKDIKFVNTNMTTLGSLAFEALEHMYSFTLAGGYITEIKRSMFPMPASYLESIELNSNKLKSLPEDLFTKMPSLQQVLLDKNELTTISEVVFAPVWSQLDYVYFYGNPLKCDSDIKWIYKYRLPEHIYGYCVLPERLLHKTLRDLTLEDLK